jgi:uncharacterized DUF497 family protein
MRFEWDESKRAANLVKHGLDFADLGRLDWERAAILEDRRFGYGEMRYWAFGMMDSQLHLVAFTKRGESLRVISFRRASKKERKRYGAVAP